MTERMLKPKDVAEIMGISVSTARVRMLEMPGCVNVGAGKSLVLRVPESGLEAWKDNRVIVVPKFDGHIARRPIGRQRERALCG